MQQRNTNETVSNFCSTQGIAWDFIPEYAPHFWGLLESAVKSLKSSLRRVVGDIKFSLEELATILAQIEPCLNSRPLGITPHYNDDGIEVLTLRDFLIDHPMEPLPGQDVSYHPMSVLCHWYLCKALVLHFWKRWQSEWVTSLRKYSKWHQPTINLQVGHVVMLREDNTMLSQWPITWIVESRQDKDGLVRVVKLRTGGGTYTRPVKGGSYPTMRIIITLRRSKVTVTRERWLYSYHANNNFETK